MSTSLGGLNTARVVEDNVRDEVRELEEETRDLMGRLRDVSDRWVRAKMHLAVADALDSKREKQVDAGPFT